MGRQEVEKRKKDKMTRDDRRNRILSGDDASLNNGVYEVTRVIEARDSVTRQSVDIATDVTQLSVECQGEEDGGKNTAKVLGDKTGPAEQLKVPAAVEPNFRMKIAAMKLGDMGAITPNKVSVKMLEVPEAFEAPSGQNGCEPGRAEETFREEFGPASDQEGGEHRCGRSEEFGEACPQEGRGDCTRAEEIFHEEFGEAHESS